MKLISLLADIVVNHKESIEQIQPLYGPPSTEPVPANVTPIIAFSAVCVGVVVGIVILVKKSLKKKNDINNAQALYGPPQMFNKQNELDDKSKTDIIENENQKEE